MSDKEIKELKKEEMEKSTGGWEDGKEAFESEEQERRDKYCYGDPEGGPHNWIRTGNHEERGYFIFWNKGYDEFRYTKCGATKWEH